MLIVPLGPTWKQSWLVEMRVCHSTTGCKTLKRLNKLHFTLSCSPCRLCTNLYLSSHHTFAWEWLASPRGHLIWNPCFIHTNTHTFIILVLGFSSGPAVPSVPAIRTRPEVLQCGCTIQAGNNANPRHCRQRCWIGKSPGSPAAL